MLNMAKLDWMWKMKTQVDVLPELPVIGRRYRRTWSVRHSMFRDHDVFIRPTTIGQDGYLVLRKVLMIYNLGPKLWCIERTIALREFSQSPGQCRGERFLPGTLRELIFTTRSQELEGACGLDAAKR